MRHGHGWLAQHVHQVLIVRAKARLGVEKVVETGDQLSVGRLLLEAAILEEFHERGIGRVLIRHPEHQQFFDQTARDSHEKGWSELFTQLETVLA